MQVVHSETLQMSEKSPYRISERTIAGLEKARKQGRIGGRPRLTVNRDELARLDSGGLTMAEIAEQLGISAASVCRMLKAHRIQRGMSQAIV
jgi:DNA invertase Pin-like site-specific DNA recombinase